MSRGKKVEGTCHICGAYGPLSFEHVPPRAAFNDRPVVGFAHEVLLSEGLDPDPKKGTISQRGAGAYTLCGRCNNVTGSWYGRHFVEWCYQGMQVLIRARGKPTLVYLNYLFPLAIIKQVVTMFFSVNSDQFRLAHPYLVDFVLDRRRKYLPPNVRVYAYYAVSGNSRAISVSGMLNLYTSQVRVMSEVSFPPFGYVLMFEPKPPHRDLVDISDFARYDHNEFAVMNLQLPALETHTPLPGDYRTREQIRRGAARQGGKEADDAD